MNTFKIKRTKVEPVPMGQYTGRIVEAKKVEGHYGEQVRLKFDLEGQPEKYVHGWASANFNERTKLFAWTAAAMGGQIPEDVKEFTPDMVMGKVVKLSILLKNGTNGEFNKIDEVKPVESQPNLDPNGTNVWDE